MLQAQSAVESYLSFMARWRWTVLLLTLTAAILFASGMAFLTVNEDYRILFSEGNPQLLAYERLEDEFTQFDNVFFIVAAEDADVFAPGAYRAVHELTEAAWTIPYAQRVDSITNFQYSRAEGDDLIVSPLVEDPAAATQAELSEAREIALHESGLVNLAISKQGDVTGINVSIRLPGLARGEREAVMATAERIGNEIRSAYPGVAVYITGQLAMNVAFKEAALHDITVLVPSMYVCVTLAVLLLLRSFAAACITVLIVALSTTTGMGLAGWLGFELSASSAAAPTLIMTLAIADSVHVLLTMLRRMWEGHSQAEALRYSMHVNFNPVFLTSLTTVIGYLTMNYADSPPLRDVGNITAMGVAAAFFYTIVLLPALASILKIRVKPRAEMLALYLDRLGRFVVARWRMLLVTTGSAVTLLASAIPLNEINDQWLEYFDTSTSFRQASEFSANRLTGVYAVQYTPDSGMPGGITSPEYLATMDAYTLWLREQPGVVHVSSLVDTLKRLNKNMHEDDPDSYRLPEDRELAAQLLLVYEMSLPAGLGLESQLDTDRSAMRVTAVVSNMTSNRLRQLSEAGTQWLRDNAPAHMVSEGIGPAIMFAHLADRNIRGMVRGTAVAFLLISGVLLLALRSGKYAVIALIPNVVPALCAFGIWGLSVGYVGFAVWTVGAMSLGFVVDDTIHFLSKYAYARRQLRQPAAEAVVFAFTTVGPALVVTSAILCVGFLVISLSTFRVNSDVGLLTTLVVVCALAADLLLLPPLLMLLDRGDTASRIPASSAYATQEDSLG